jgi:RNA polymerase sigma factor (sigma-70 family)
MCYYSMNIESSKYSEVVDHLFRQEAGRITSVLTKIFGIENFELAEDVVQDTLMKALRQWPYTGLPDNPSAWLFKAAKNRAVDLLRRKKLSHKYAGRILNSEWILSGTVNEFFSENEIKDGQLRMIFTCCHPGLPGEAQVALALKYLCGFSVKEIAKAFLVNEATISKRLIRAREKFKNGSIRFEIPTGAALEKRLQNVLSTIYLLFNEGYNSSDEHQLIKADLIEEALRLAELLAEHHHAGKREVYALLALMFFHYARSPARIDDRGNILLLKEQNRYLWDRKLIAKGVKYLNLSSGGDVITEYHLEAGIAYFYTIAKSFDETDWEKILNLYNILYKLNNSFIIGLNRAIVISQLQGPSAGINELYKLGNKELLSNYHHYYSTLGEFYFQSGDYTKAKLNFENSFNLTGSEVEKKLLKKKISEVNIITHDSSG